MNSHEAPRNVLDFIEHSIDSVPELEALLLLRENESREWSDAEIAARIYVSREEAARVLESLHRRRLIAATGETPLYNFKPAREDMREIVAEVAAAYRRHLISIAVYIHRKSSASVREFARAFDLKKER